MTQILRWPVSVFSQTRSAWPVPRKSPVAAIFHSTEIVGRLITLAGTPLFRTQILCCPVTVFSQTSALTIDVGVGVGATANRGLSCSPVMKLALIATPIVASYLPTVPVPGDWMLLIEKIPPTKRLLPDTASPVRPLSPVMKLALIAAPVVALYSPTVPKEVRLKNVSATKRAVPSADNASPMGLMRLPVMKLALITAPVAALYSPTVGVSRLSLVGTKRTVLSPDNAS